MSRAQSRNAVSLILAFGLMCSVFPTARGDDGKDPAKAKPQTPPSPAAAKPAPPTAEARGPGGCKACHTCSCQARGPGGCQARCPRGREARGPSEADQLHPGRRALLVENCIACHNPRKAESKYVMTTFAQLAKGGQQGEGITLEAGKPDESRFVELVRIDGQPRMPYKQDPLAAEKIATIERWVAEGAKYDGARADGRLDDRAPQDASGHGPRSVSRGHPDHGAGVQPGRGGPRGVRLS